MSARPAYRKLLNPAHEYVGNSDTCEWEAADGRPCALPRMNRHHNVKAQNGHAEPSEESRQLRLDIDG